MPDQKEFETEVVQFDGRRIDIVSPEGISIPFQRSQANCDMLDRSEAHRDDLRITVDSATQDDQWIPGEVVDPAIPKTIHQGQLGIGRKGREALMRALNQLGTSGAPYTFRKKLSAKEKAKKKSQRAARKRNRK